MYFSRCMLCFTIKVKKNPHKINKTKNELLLKRACALSLRFELPVSSVVTTLLYFCLLPGHKPSSDSGQPLPSPLPKNGKGCFPEPGAHSFWSSLHWPDKYSPTHHVVASGVPRNRHVEKRKLTYRWGRTMRRWAVGAGLQGNRVQVSLHACS